MAHGGHLAKDGASNVQLFPQQSAEPPPARVAFHDTGSVGGTRGEPPAGKNGGRSHTQKMTFSFHASPAEGSRCGSAAPTNERLAGALVKGWEVGAVTVRPEGGFQAPPRSHR